MITVIATIWLGISALCALILWAACVMGKRADRSIVQHQSIEEGNNNHENPKYYRRNP